MMRSLLSTHSLPLLLLLLPPLCFLQVDDRFFLSDDLTEEFEEYVDEFHDTGPTRAPTKEKFIKIILEPERPLTDSTYCSDEIKFKNIHKGLKCFVEHYFFKTKYEEIQDLCYSTFVKCKNGIRRCHRSRKLIEGPYCKLKKGNTMPNCEYESFYRKVYVLITCQWQNKIHELVPESVTDMLPST
ncbi:inactive ribonuclease-like protein 9 [Choloepus didactylus]|uniref:inactive ribonuclease-like protein 9 n=1 Tax=Choloepus didactylus TaxID=27675 RepID=UPI0018A11EF7|nr:inactive ribonuclease-like protein 9 [Choloepus didactylus]